MSVLLAPPLQTSPIVLTEREKETISLLALGFSGKQIADVQKISIRGAEANIARCRKKMGAKNIAELIYRACTSGQIH
jgi:DNA-binding CsgD family transcriptional regulator